MLPHYEPKLFCCNVCGWILGESYREPSIRITQLRVYRNARAPELGADLRPLAVAVKFVALKVNDGAVLCEHCGGETSWYANQTAISEMLERKSLRAGPKASTEKPEAVQNG